MKKEIWKLVLCGFALSILPSVGWAWIIQGPVKGTITLADGREADDIVVRLICFSSGIHGGHRADNVTRIVSTVSPRWIPSVRMADATRVTRSASSA